MSILSFRNSFLIFLLLLHHFPLFMNSFAPQNCSDGAPAVFPCNATKVDGKKVFVCALDLMLGCEFVEGQFYCCAQTETTTLSRMEMILVDQMMADEIKNKTLSVETEETLELMNEHLVANLVNNLSTFNQTAENIDGPTMSNENGEMMGNGTNDEMETTTTTTMMTAKMVKMRKKSRRKQGMMVNVEKQILVDNSVEQEEEEKEEEEEGIMANASTMSTTRPDNNMTTITTIGMPSSTSLSMIKSSNKMDNQATKRPICIDIGPQCLLTAKLCLNPRYSRLVRLQCPRTCNLCAPDGHRMKEDAVLFGKCIDKGKDCGRAEFLCQTPAFSALMALECAKTCGHCGQNVGVHAKGVKTNNGNKKKAEKSKKSEKCMDAYQRCQIWQLQGFCTSSTYSEFLKRRYCAKTCGFCGKKGSE